MTTLNDLLHRVPQVGRVVWIGLRPLRKDTVVAVPSVEIDETGLAGDHGRGGARAVTLIQAEHLPVIAALSGRDAVPPDLLRRNLVVAGINLTALKQTGVQIGGARLALTGPCAPCSRMEEALGPGGYAAMRGHGGWCARVVASGRVALDARVTALAN